MSTPINDGGPVASQFSCQITTHPGAMNLRDFFAASATNEDITYQRNAIIGECSPSLLRYMHADDMIRERERKP